MEEDRIELRELEEKYAKDLIDLFNNDNVIKYTNSDKLDNYLDIERKIKNILAYDGYNYVIIYNNLVIGVIGCILDDVENLGYGLYYMIKEKYWGKGLGKLAVKNIIDRINIDSRVNFIFADIVSLNKASIRIVESLGFYRYVAEDKQFCMHGLEEAVLNYRLIIGVNDSNEKNNKG